MNIKYLTTVLICLVLVSLTLGCTSPKNVTQSESQQTQQKQQPQTSSDLPYEKGGKVSNNPTTDLTTFLNQAEQSGIDDEWVTPSGDCLAMYNEKFNNNDTLSLGFDNADFPCKKNGVYTTESEIKTIGGTILQNSADPADNQYRHIGFVYSASQYTSPNGWIDISNGNIAGWSVIGDDNEKPANTIDPKLKDEYQTYKDIMIKKLKDAVQRYNEGQLKNTARPWYEKKK